MAMNSNSGYAYFVLFCPAWRKSGSSRTCTLSGGEIPLPSGFSFQMLIKKGKSSRGGQPCVRVTPFIEGVRGIGNDEQAHRCSHSKQLVRQEL